MLVRLCRPTMATPSAAAGGSDGTRRAARRPEGGKSDPSGGFQMMLTGQIESGQVGAAGSLVLDAQFTRSLASTVALYLRIPPRVCSFPVLTICIAGTRFRTAKIGR